jgi:hypothetical protein
MAFQPFGQWLPDQGVYNNPGASVAKNVVPRTASSYAPLPDLSAVSVAMSNRPQGAHSFKNEDGTVYTFAGDLQDLFKFGSDDVTFDEVSKSSAAYTVNTADHWRFAKFGTRVIAVNGHTDHPQTFVMGTASAFSDLAGSGPRARQIGVIRDHVMVGDTWDSVDGDKPNRVWFPAIADPTDWPTIGSADAAAKQSDYQDLAVGGQVQGIVGSVGGIDGAIFSDTAIHRVMYQGPPTVFSILPIEEDNGTIAPMAILHTGTVVLYLGEDGWYIFDGQSSRQIGDDRVDSWFYNRLNRSFNHRIYGAADTINKVAYWAFPSTDSALGTPDSIIMYNWGVDRWSYGVIDCEMLFRDLTYSYTMEGLDNLGYTMETLPASLDSDYWKGGLQQMTAFNTSNQSAIFTGSNLEATLETAEFGEDHMSRWHGARPMIDGGTVTVGIKTRDLPGATAVLTGPNAVDFDGLAHFNDKVARFARAQVIIAAAGTWTHAKGIMPHVSREGIV